MRNGKNSSSESLKSGIYTFRSVKAIQSKIYQIKPEVKKDMEFLRKVQADYELAKSLKFSERGQNLLKRSLKWLNESYIVNEQNKQ